MNSEENKARNSLIKKNKNPLLFKPQIYISLLIIVLIVSVLVFFPYRYAERLSRERSQMYMFSAAKTSKQQIQYWLGSIMSKCELIKLNNNNESSMYTAFLKNSPLRKELQKKDYKFNEYLKNIRSTLSCKSIVLSSKDGGISLSDNCSAYGLAENIKEIIRESIDKNEVRISPVNFDSQSRSPYISFVVPFIPYTNPDKKEESLPQDALVITYDLESELSKIFRASSMIKSKTFEELIVFKKGDSLVLLNKLSIDGKKWMPLLIPMTNGKSPSYYVLDENEGVFIGVDYRGQNVISAAAYIPELEWGGNRKNRQRRSI